MLTKLNLAALKGGPAIIYKGPSVFYSKNGVDLDISAEWEDIVLDGYDVVDQRKKKQPIVCKFTPSGVYNPSTVQTLCELATLPLGQFITPVFSNITANSGTNKLTVPLHGRQTGESGYIVAQDAGVIPSGLAAGTLYYLGVVDANTLQLYATQANALSSTDPIALGSAGTAPFALVINNVLVIWSYTGDMITLGNCGIQKMPDVQLTADGKTIFGEVEIACFIKHGCRPQDANSFFTFGNEAFDPTTFPNLAQILTQPYEANWGAQILNVTSATVASPTVITTDVPHGLVTGQSVNLIVPGSTPAINAAYVVTVLSATTFSVAVDVTAAGDAGTVQLVVANPWGNIQTKDGFKLKFNAKIEDVMVDGLGVPTRQLTGATAELSFLPTDAGAQALLDVGNVQGAGGVLGASLQAGAANLNLIGTNFYGILYAANFVKLPMKWNMKDRRAAEVTMRATRQIVGGVAQPLMFLGAASPY